MSSSEDIFESRFGVSMPPVLGELFANVLSKDSFPMGLRLGNVDFVLELQFPLDWADAGNSDPERKHLAFAVTTDGNKLLVDLNTRDLDILQDEHGDIDAIGVSARDLLEAELYSL